MHLTNTTVNTVSNDYNSVIRYLSETRKDLIADD